MGYLGGLKPGGGGGLKVGFYGIPENCFNTSPDNLSDQLDCHITVCLHCNFLTHFQQSSECNDCIEAGLEIN